MLCLARKIQEGFQVTTKSGEVIHIAVNRIAGNVVQIGIEAARDIRVVRDELIGRDPPPRRAA